MRHTQRYRSLPFNPALKARAKKLRQARMLHEVLMWNRLKLKQLNGLDFDRQKIIGNYIVDFYCAEKSVVIELDGPSHDARVEVDAQRDAFMQGLGITILRIPVSEVLGNLDGVMEWLSNLTPLAGTGSPEDAIPPRPSATPPREGNFLRPADEPTDTTLLRPAGPGEAEVQNLLRPAVGDECEQQIK